ncbi:MAG: glycosyltransferase family 4 protein [Gammaproteobacteria bacterium]|nr:glycosyltransferase family 4 protein [Gammaproteobacteria bacterium]NNE04969.1 glycosyltransferase family 4 protein [Xanthomonadales bacterium]
MTVIAAVNQDRGIQPGRAKGAAVHLNAMRSAFSDLGATVYPMDMPHDDQLLLELERLDRSRGIDLVYERYALGSDTAAQFAARRDIPLVLEVNSPLANEQEQFRNRPETDLEQQRDRKLFGLASRIMCVSSLVAEYACARGADPALVEVCPNGIDASRFHPGVAPDAALEELRDEHCVIGFHGRQRPWHGFDQLARVTRGLLERGLPLHLLVVGEGAFDELDMLPESAWTRLGWQAHEKMPGLVATYHVLPLNYQPGLNCYFSPLKLMEAMACGVVPVVPDLGDLPSLVRHELNGLVFPAGDDEALAACLARLSTDDTLRTRLGGQAAKTATGHSWHDIAAGILRSHGVGQRSGETG